MGGFGPAGGTSHLDPALVGTGYAAVSTSAWYTCAIRAAPRTLRCWGWNPWSFLAPVDTAEDWASVTTGVSSACGVTSGGALLCWGDGESGQLGDGTTTSRIDPAPVATVASGTRWTAVAVGRDHACGIRDDASLWCWGLNQGGSLGDGTTVQRNAPVSPGGSWAAVAAGVDTTCGVRTDGTLHCWGGGGIPGIPGEPSPTAVGTEAGWVGVTVGGAHVCAWKADGTATCWGENGSGERGSGEATSDATSSSVAIAVASISAAGHSTCAVTPEGRLHCWGSNADGVAGIGTVGSKRSPIHVLPGRTFTSLSAGYFGTCAVSGGRRFCTGYNGTGRLGDGTRTSRTTLGATDSHGDWRSVQLSSSFGCGFRGGDALECWGTGSAIGATRLAPAPVGPAGAWNQIALGGDGICGTTRAGALECWGDNSRGALGDGTTLSRAVPAEVSGGGTWSAVSASADHACAIRSNGQLACWGGNDTSELGTGDSVDHLHPTDGMGGDWSRVATGQSHTCSIRNGVVLCWGSGTHGAAGYDGVGHGRNVPAPVLTWDPVLGFTNTAASEIATGAFHSCAISAGELRCWGSGVVPHVVWVEPPGVFEKMVAKRIGTASDWTAVSLGRKHTCGLRNGGQLWCWGENGNGELGDGQGFYATPMLVPLPAP